MHLRFALLVVLGGCIPRFLAGESSVIACQVDAECPPEWRCGGNGLCVKPLGNLAPTVTARVQNTGRPTTALEIAFELADQNGYPIGTQQAAVALAYSFDQATWCEARQLGGAVTGLATAGAPQTHVLTWNALEEETCQPAVRMVDSDGDSAPDARVLDDAAALWIRLEATDDGEPPRTSAPAGLGPFPIGNSPPAVQLLPVTQTSGLVPILFALTDIAGDAADVELQVQLPGEPTWRPAAIFAGTSTGLFPRTEPYLLIWDSLAAPQAGGVGVQNLDAVALRLRASDHPSPAETHYGDWVVVNVPVNNQTPPEVGVITPLNDAGATFGGVLLLSYRLFDATSDTASVAVEYSVDGGLTYAPCSEYPGLLSEGRRGLASAPRNADGTGGRVHLFAWDTGTDVRGGRNATLLRFAARDSSAAGSATVIALGPEIGPGDGLPVATEQRAALASGGAAVALGDFNADGHVDMAYSGTGTTLWVAEGKSGVTGALFAAPFSRELTAMVLGLVAGEFTGDVYTDLAVTTGSTLSLLKGGPGGLAAASVEANEGGGSPSDVMVSADLNQDGHMDLAWSAGNALHVMLGDGLGGVMAATGSPYAPGGQVIGLAAGDVTGDGIVDLVLTYTNGAQVDGYFGFYRLQATLAIRPGNRKGDFSASTVVASDVIAATLDSWSFYGGAFVAVADLDGDGTSEMITTHVALPAQSVLRVFHKEGNGFVASDSAAFAGWAQDIKVGDINADGLLDVMTAVYPRPSGQNGFALMSVRSAASPWLFEHVAAAVVPSCASNTSARMQLASADLTRDARADVLLACRSGGSWSVVPMVTSTLANRRDDSVELSATVSSGLDPAKLTATDLDYDGNPDVLATSTVLQGVYALQNKASVSGASRGALQVVGAGAFGALQSPIYGFADFNGDGVTDTVGYDNNTDRQSVILASTAAGVGVFDFEAVFAWPTMGSLGRMRQNADFNDDGFDDMLLNDGTLQVALAQVTGSEWTGSFVAQSATADVAAAPTISDFDGDGILDVAGVSSGTAYVWKGVAAAGKGTGTLGTPCGVAGVVGTLRASSAGDYNGDGAVDIVFASDNGVTTLLNVVTTSSGCPSSVSVVDAAVPLGVKSILSADVDGDGWTEMVIATDSGVYAVAPQLVSGIPSGPYAPARRLGAFAAGQITAADFNGDGLLDLAGGVGGSLRVALQHARSPLAVWSAPVELVGLPPDSDARLAMRPWQQTFTSAAAEKHPDFLTLLRRHAVSGTRGVALRPMGPAYLVEGAHMLEANASGRHVLQPRFGEELAMAAGRAVIFALPLSDAASTTNSTSAADRIRVFARHLDYVRADTWPADPLYGDATARTLLPLVPGRDRPVMYPLHTWAAVPRDSNDNLADGTGERFAARRDASGRIVIRILTDTLGVFQAFALPGG